MFESILVPLDGSPDAESALAVATRIPCRTLRLLRVQPASTELDEVRSSEKDNWTYLEAKAESLRRQGRKVETHVAIGEPGRQIVAYGAPSDLVVMGSEGRGATKSFVLGSVAEWVARHAMVPTLIVRCGQKPAAMSSASRVVVPVDGSTLADSALPFAETFATNVRLPVHLVRVLDFDPVRAAVRAGVGAARASSTSREGEIHLAEEHLARLAQQLRDRGFTASHELRHGRPSSELLKVVTDGDLVILTTRDRGELARWMLGSVADELIRHAPVPVVLVRAAP